ncbi:hypothetical protein [Crocosphaera sp. XPORK-15E]|uniref:hypothetical protein n=1 Tax=Crocosphaera sp. XPORK-15E TaxID=3110247 RepID=UPI002B1FEEED|nr:hypothetical protein [Crocosphaera sp. XPORK-15E]MEA5534953.1 hypothetical protein [Crocosphaera sp. XPORK-15E]
MKRVLASFFFLGVLIFPISSLIAQNRESSLTGRIQQVWEDGFRLETTDRKITVDSYDVCGDNTTRHLSVGDQVTVRGEMSGREFDAFSITKADDTRVCVQKS